MSEGRRPWRPHAVGPTVVILLIGGLDERMTEQRGLYEFRVLMRLTGMYLCTCSSSVGRREIVSIVVHICGSRLREAFLGESRGFEF